MPETRQLHGSKVLITGGAGFIGSNLTATLLDQDNEVIVLDNFSTGKRDNLQPFINHPAFTLIEGDIRNLEDCKKAVQGVTYVFHQAALGSVPRSLEDPITTNEVNVSGFLNMLVASRDEGVKRFIYAASSSTYGDSKTLPKVEEHIGKPLSPYAITKYVNELYAEVFASQYGLEFIGLRYFNVFGRNQDPEGAYAAVIPKFVKALLEHESPVINGDGNHTRDFTYVDNVIQVNQLAALVDDPLAVNQVYNVACNNQTTLNQLFESIRNNLVQFDPKVKGIHAIYGPERQGDIKHSNASIDKARELLGYDPEIDAQEGIQLAVSWYVDNYQHQA